MIENEGRANAYALRDHKLAVKCTNESAKACMYWSMLMQEEKKNTCPKYRQPDVSASP